MMKKTEQDRIRTHWRGFIVGVAALTLALPAFAGQREQAKRMHDRLTGVPPTAAVLDSMEGLMPDAQAAALLAINPAQNPNAKYFYNVTLKNFATPWTNEAQDVFAPLNDYTALVIGMIRDDVPFSELFSTSLAYEGAASLGLTPVSPSNNNHYVALEASGADLGDTTLLVQTSQSIAAGGAAGVFSTRAAARAFFIDGTNRSMFRFAMLNHLCRDMEAVNDTTGIPDRIRQDASRSPGGDSRIFMNSCIGCHIGMDPMTQAFAYYDFVYPEGNEDAGQLVYTPDQVQPKYLINADNFSSGYVTPNDNWDNYWRSGPNTSLGWDTARTGSGTGAASMGAELANSEAFAQCQVTKAYRMVCLGEPGQTNVDALLAAYGANKNMKQVFASAATLCTGP
ncbi:FIG01036274: hypothetical protein [hydrothermal vent metagenome]|uniref:DUF1585 domain-containing protein n=1 Tax=hydrothermal vent metagenome TaxID=652676 RepID=A0A3B0YVN3_9ZZZZ